MKTSIILTVFIFGMAMLIPNKCVSQNFILKPGFAYNFHKIKDTKFHSMGGGLTFEKNLGNASSATFSMMYFGGNGVLTLEDFKGIIDTDLIPTNSDKIAERNNLDMFRLGAGYRKYLQGTDMEGPYAGIFLGYGITTQDNPIGYYYDIGAQVGYQKLLDSGLAFEVFAKIGYGMWIYDVDYWNVYYGYYPTYGVVTFDYFNMLLVQSGISIGIGR